VFDDLKTVSSRFSKYKEDHDLDSRAFSTIDELDKEIKKANEKLTINGLSI
jgi:hypothetical protein